MDLANHEMGLELQLIELSEQWERAHGQGREDDAQRIQREISLLQEEMALTAERMAAPAGRDVDPDMINPDTANPDTGNPAASAA